MDGKPALTALVAEQSWGAVRMVTPGSSVAPGASRSELSQDLSPQVTLLT